MRISRILPLALSVVLLSSCSLSLRDTGEDLHSSPTHSTTEGPTALPTESMSAAPTKPTGKVLGRATVTGDLGSEPTITIDKTVPDTSELLTKDITVGTGAAIQASSTVTVQYVGVGGNTGKVFDSSWASGQPATFPLNGVIVGWQNGLFGAKVGARRILVIPGPMAYGMNPPTGSGIEPNETLVFVVDVVGVQ